MPKLIRLTADEERAKQSHLVNVAIGLECRLRNLAREILVDKRLDKIGEFQQFIQYAPDATRERIYKLIEGGDLCRR